MTDGKIQIGETKEEIWILDGTQPIPEDRKKFLQNQRVMATYKSHINKEKLLEFWTKKLPFEMVFWRAAHETADKTDPYEHTHVLVDFGKCFQTTTCRFFDFVLEDGTVLHPNFKMIKRQLHWENSLNYIAKEDPANADLKKKPALTTKVWDARTVQEALEKNVRKPSDVTGILALYNNKPREMELKSMTEKFCGWQYELWEELTMSEGDDRKIIWVFEEKGGTGKTVFSRSLMIDNPKDVLVTTAVSGAYHMATIIRNHIAEGWNGNIFLMNLTRAAEDHKIYEGLEAIRDGMITSQKYQGGTVLFDVKHLVVFANWLPNFDALSLDRWDVREIVGASGGLEATNLRRLNVNECRLRREKMRNPHGL